MAGNAIPNFSRVGFLDVLLHKGARVEVEHQSRSSDTISASVLLPGLIFATGLPGFNFFPFQSANPERTKFWIRSSRNPEAGIIRPTSTPRSVITTVFPAFTFLMYSLRWVLSSRIPTLFSAIRTTPRSDYIIRPKHYIVDRSRSKSYIRGYPRMRWREDCPWPKNIAGMVFLIRLAFEDA